MGTGLFIVHLLHYRFVSIIFLHLQTIPFANEGGGGGREGGVFNKILAYFFFDLKKTKQQDQYLLLPDATANAKKILIWLAISAVFFILLFSYVYWKFKRIQLRRQLVAVNDDENEE
ncbi:hypothetical protein RFI_13028 [Reticulomyxa filosa]|uniref:Uncharacterized protein n=1 Tax=Reticulomyxa filosa TaxID=46433 RepID=X6NFL1_RETFI|nr:hypothetical protein RFI_13028 [Reticulomyxa filosa]|eukprot:ETO24132.1 hypothetical protein RFI_13028 [Reticulomyxa filosa]